MTAPTPTVEFAPGYTWKTPDADLVWVDITDDVLLAQKVTTSRGRRSIQDRFSTGSIGLNLKNERRNFDTMFEGTLFPSTSLYPSTTLYPGGGSYFGQLVPGVPIRVTTTPSGEATKDVARGFVSGWPQRYDIGNTFAYVPISGFGIFDKLARAKLPESVWQLEAGADDCWAWWRLNETTGTVLADSSGSGHPAALQYERADNLTNADRPAVAVGETLVPYDGASSLALATQVVGDTVPRAAPAVVRTDLPTSLPLTVEAWVIATPWEDASSSYAILWLEAGGLVFYVGAASDASDTHQYRPEAYWSTASAGYSLIFLAPLPFIDLTDRPHHLAFVATSGDLDIYLDGELVAVAAISGSLATPTKSVLTVGALREGTTSGIWPGRLGDVRVYESALDAARIAAHYAAGAAPWDGDLTNERLDRVLDTVDLPSDRRDFETGQTSLGPAILQRANALDYLRLVEATEDGRMFETADGKVRFLDRYWGAVDSHGTTSQLTFSDLSGVSYSTLEIDPDDELLVNVATITRPDGSATIIRNDTSVDAYGEADLPIDTLLQTEAEARSLGEHVTFTRGTPQPRVGKLSVPLHKYTGAEQADILDLEIGYRITVERTPQGVGAEISLELIVEGIDHRIDTFEHWIDFNVSVAPADTDFFVWGVSEWGVSTTWGW